MQNRLRIIDERTNKEYFIPIEDGTIRATDLGQIKLNAEDEGLRSHDPSFRNTTSCRSAITYIDGEKGILLYRGYPIEQLAEQSTYLETAYLLVKGDLPDTERQKVWLNNITTHTMVHENVKKFMSGFRYDAHPMSILISTVAALATFYPEAQNIKDLESRRLQTRRLIGKMPTIAAFAYRRARGLPYVQPDNELPYTANFLSMLFRMSEPRYAANPVVQKALEVLFILHADHEQNCSTNAMRSVASSHVDPYTAIAAGASALFGPLHGGANEEVVRMLREIGTTANIPSYLERVKKKEVRLMGFGHRVYKSYDPRARIIKKVAHEVFEVTRRNPLLDVALELERIALEDDYFIKRDLYPNVDFYSGLIYDALGLPVEMFPVLFAIPRVSGWLAHWAEHVMDKEQQIVRPRQIYIGPGKRDFVPIDRRPPPKLTETLVSEKL